MRIFLRFLIKPSMLRLSSLLLFVSASFQAVADVAITETYVIINSGSGNYYYEGKDNGGTNTAFSTINATVNLLASPTLTLNGGQTKTSASGGDYQNNTNYENLYYRFYDSAGAAGSYSTISESYSASQPAYPNYTWETSNSNINLISGKASGTYYLDVYWDGNGSWWNGSSQQYYTSSANTYGSSGSPIRATYTLFYGATATGTQASAFTGTGYFNFNGSGQTYTLNAANTYTGQTQIDAGTVSITSTGSLSSSSVVYLGNGGNSSNAALTLAGTTTFANALTANQSSGSGTRTITKSDATSQTMSGSITLNQLTTFDVASGGSLTLSGVVEGTNSFTKTSAGTMTLSGTSANTFSVGTVTVSAGTLVLNKSANTAAIAGRPVIVSSGATLRTDAAGQIGSAPLVTVTGIFDLNGNNQSVALDGAGTVKLDGSSSSGTLTITNSGTDTFSGLITDNARTDGAVTKSGTGRQILTGTNAYDGLTTVSGGVLRIGQANALGSTTGGTTVSSGAALELSNSISIGAEVLTLSGDGVSAGGSLRNVSGNNSWAGNITNSSAARINSDSGTLTISGTISNAASQSLYFGGAGNVTVDGAITGNRTTGDGALYKDGTGNLTLSANNSGLTGLLRLKGGTVTVTNGNSFGSGSVEFGSGATLVTLQVNSNTTIANRFELDNNTTNAVINVASGQTATFSGVLSQTNGTVNTNKFGKDGAGTLVFNNGGGTYNGQIQIGQGNVVLGASSALGTNLSTSFRGVDLGLNVGDTSTANNVELRASNNVTVGQSIYVAPNTSSAKRTIGLSGTGTATFSNEIYLDGNLTVDAGSSGTVAITGVIATNYLGGGGGIITTNGTVILSGANTYNGGTTVGSGSTLKIGAGAGTGALGGGNVTNNGTLVFDRTGAISWANLISGTGALTKTNTGTLTLSGANTYSGDTTIQGGILQVSVTNNLGASNNGVTINNGGTLRATANMTNTRNITITTGNTGYVEAAAGTTNTLNGTLSKNGSVLVLGGGGTHIVNGSITGANANSDLVVSNSTTTINSTNSYNGPTFIVAAGTLNNGTNNALPTDTALTLGQAGETSSTTNRYNLNGYSQTVASVATAGSSVNIVTNSTGTGNLTLNSSSAKSISNLTMGGTGLTLTKSGANTVTLASGNNIGPGTIAIQQGTLLLGAANQIGDSTAINLSGGTLNTAGYADAAGKLTVSANSTIQGLNSTSGSAFTFSDVDLGNYSTSSGSALTFVNSTGGNYSLGTVFQISTVAANSWTGYSETSLNNFSQKIQFGNGNIAQINFGTGSAVGISGGGSVSWTTLTVAAIPEPKVYLAAGALALLIGFAEFRRRKKIDSSRD